MDGVMGREGWMERWGRERWSDGDGGMIERRMEGEKGEGGMDRGGDGGREG